MKIRLHPLFVFAFPLMAYFSYGQANFLSGGEITYRHVSGSTYDVSLVLYKDCESSVPLGNTQVIAWNSVTCSKSGNITANLSNLEIIRSCATGIPKCSGGSVLSYEKRTYVGRVTLTDPCTDYTFRWSGSNRSARINTLNGAGPFGMYLEATLNTVDAPSNNSVQFTTPHLNFIFAGLDYIYSIGAVDPDNINSTQDVLTYEFIKPRANFVTEIEYKSGYSISQQIKSTAPISISSSGNIYIEPLVSEVQTITTMVMKITETRAGKVVGTTMRDMQVEVFSTEVDYPLISGVDGTSGTLVNACVNESVNFKIYGNSQVTGIPMSLRLLNGPAGAVFNTVEAVGTTTGIFNWVPTQPGTYVLVFEGNNNACPVEARITKTISVVVSPAPTLTFNIPRDTIVSCTANTSITAQVTGGTSPYVYSWSNGSTSPTIAVSGAASLFVRVTDRNGTGCSTGDSLNLRSNVTAFFDFPRDSVCKGVERRFNDFSFSRPSSNFIKRWEWDFRDGSPNVVVTRASLSTPIPPEKNPLKAFATEGTYNVQLKVTALDNCEATFTLPVNVYEIPTPRYKLVKACQAPGSIDALNNTTVTALNPPGTLRSVWTSSDGGRFTTNNLQIQSNVTVSGYVLTLTSFNAGCSASLIRTFDVNPRPRFTKLTEPFAPKCNQGNIAAYPVTVEGIAVGPAAAISTQVRYLWTHDASLQTGEITIDARLPRNYAVRIIDTLQCQNDTVVTVLDSLAPNIIYKNYFCKTGDAILIADGGSRFRGASLAAYQWSIPRIGFEISCSGTNCLTTVNGVASSCSNCFTANLTIQPNLFVSDTIFDVYYRITDIYGCVDQQNYPAVLHTVDGSTFRTENRELCFQQNNVFYSNTGKRLYPFGNNINQWSWYFGDGTSTEFLNNTTPIIDSSTYNVSKSYNQDGRFVVTLSGTYNDGAAFSFPPLQTPVGAPVCRFSDTTTVVVFPPLKYVIDSVGYNHCVGLPTTLRATKVSSRFPRTEWTWSFFRNSYNPFDSLFTVRSLGNQPDSTSITRTFTVAGFIDYSDSLKAKYDPYFVTLTVKDSKGCVGRDSLTMNIVENAIRFTVNDAKCKNEQLTFQIEPELPASNLNIIAVADLANVKWFFGEGDTLIQSNFGFYKYQSNESKVYTVSARANDKFGYGCFASATTTGIVKKIPTARINFSSNPICRTDTLTITPTITPSNPSAGLDVVKVFWTLGDNNTTDSTLKSAFKRTFTSRGTYIYKLVVVDTSKCTDTTEATLDVREKPKAKFSLSSSDANDGGLLFAGTPIQIQDNSIVDTLSTIPRTWHWGMSGIDTLKLPNRVLDTMVTYVNEGVYILYLRVANSPSCADEFRDTIDLRTMIRQPNAFAPASSNPLNKEFKPYLSGIKKIEEFVVYNRYGQKVFESDGRVCIIENKPTLCKGWDGTFNGVEQPMGVYVYYIKAIAGSDQVKENSGKVTLIR